MGAQKNRLNETVLLSNQNIYVKKYEQENERERERNIYWRSLIWIYMNCSNIQAFLFTHSTPLYNFIQSHSKEYKPEQSNLELHELLII